MDKINWPNYNHTDFTLFCNALFTFEFGKDYRPFSAPGRDGGIDGFFSGPYQGQTGDWRFQYKFSIAPRTEAVRNLKHVLKNEAKKFGNEQFFVLATNVELLPTEVDELTRSFLDELKELSKHCSVLIWDGAKLYSLFLGYPVLELWLEEGFATAQVKGYQGLLDESVEANDFKPGTMANYFVGRESDIDQLDLFLNSERNLAILLGEAGIGKTRLVLEFFQRKVDLMPDWVPLVLGVHQIVFDKLYKALSPGKKYVLLVDDIHAYDPGVIADLKSVADQLSNVKLIFTARKLEASNALRLIKEYEKERALHIDVNELSRDDTKDAFLRYIGNTSYQHYVDALVEISHGKPILIVAILNAISNHIQVSQIKSQNFLREYVGNYFGSLIDKAKVETGLERIQVNRLLQCVALIEPFNFLDNDIGKRMSSLLSVDKAAVQRTLSLLMTNGFVNGRYVQSIKPDYYSDIILSEIDKDLVSDCIREFPMQVDNLIVNLSSVDEVQDRGNNGSLLEEILFAYVGRITTASDKELVKRILSTVSRITFVKPRIAKTAVDTYMDCLELKDHPARIEIEEEKRYNSHYSYTSFGSIMEIINYLNEIPACYDFVFRRAFKLYTLTEIKEIANVFVYDRKDVVERFKMVRQEFFIEQFDRKFKKCGKAELTFGLFCLKNFTALDFTLSDWNAANKESITITTYFLPTSAIVRKFRKRLIDLVIKMYRSKEAMDIRDDILKMIIDLPRGIFATHRNTTPYKHDAEVRAILDFFIDDQDSFNLYNRKEILEKLHWYEKWGISESLLPLLGKVKEAFKPQNLGERLSQLFSETELDILRRPNVEGYLKEQCDEIMKSADEAMLADAITSFLEPQRYPPHYYWTFQRIVERDYPTYAKALHDRLFANYRDLYNQLGARLLGTLYFFHNDTDFFWEKVELLRKLDDVGADNVLLAVYGETVAGKVTLTERDIDVIVTIYNKKEKANNYGLSMAIQHLFAVNYPDTMTIAAGFLATADQRQAEMFFNWLSDNETVRPKQMAELALHHTIKFLLAYPIEICLNRALITEGYGEVFTYLLKRFEYKVRSTIKSGGASDYDLVPDGKHAYLFKDRDEDRMKMFEMALDWYISLKGDVVTLYLAKDLISYIQPSQVFTEELFDFYEYKIELLTDNGSQLERLLDTIGIFETKDERLVQLIVNVYPNVHEFQDIDGEMYNKLRFQCYNALTQTGVKMGTAGMPFQEDLDLKELLESFINRLPEYDIVRIFLEEVLKSVVKEIERSQDKDNSTW